MRLISLHNQLRIHRLMLTEARVLSEARQTWRKTQSSIIPAGVACSSDSTGSVLSHVQGVPPCDVMFPGFCPFIHGMLLPEQAYIEAIHVAVLVAQFTLWFFIWNHNFFHIGPWKGAEALQKQSKPKEQHTASGEHCGGHSSGLFCCVYMWSNPMILKTRTPPVPFYRLCRVSHPVIL
jgi:hypothetical protein